MRIGPFTLFERTAPALQQKSIPLSPLSGRGSWWPVIREPYMGAWQRNNELSADTALSFSAVFACTTLIMGDIGKLSMRLVEWDDEDRVWTPRENPAYSPVLRTPNHYQNSQQFIETWVASKLNSGNTYVLKQRDGRGVVNALYVLDPARVTPMVAQDRSIYYELKRDDISGLPKEIVLVPASEMIHDRLNSFFHPLMGVSPLYALAQVTRQGLSIQNNSSKIFSNASVPGGILTAPGKVTAETAARVKADWEERFSGDNIGRLAVAGDGLEYKPIAWNAVDLQLIEQLQWTGVTVCGAYKVNPYLVSIGTPPPYANITPLIQLYYAVCLQPIMTAIEKNLDRGLSLGLDYGNRYGVELDPDDLIWLDAEAKSKAAQDGIGSGGMSPNEARQRYYGLGPVKGGDSPMVQQQYYSLAALAERDADKPFAKPAPAPAPEMDEEDDDEMMMAASFTALHRKMMSEGLYGA
jgi:HK97 family phage portal protein